MSAAGSLALVPYADIKAVCFVRDFDVEPPTAQQLAFANRPKAHGLWIRLTFRDNQTMEALIANNLLQMEASGLTVTPPEGVWNSQKIWIPRSALTEVQVLGVVGVPTRKPARKPEPSGQLRIFDEPG